VQSNLLDGVKLQNRLSSYLNSSRHFVVVHVSRDSVEMLLIGDNVDAGVTNNVADVADQDCEHENAHQPGRRHEQDLGHVRRFLVLPDRCRRLCGEIKTPENSSQF